MSSKPSQGAAKETLLNAHLQDLGRSLSAAREAHGQSVEELARRLRMGVEQLRALEEGDRGRLPEMVFVIAQARRVASILDLCVDDQIDALRKEDFSSIAPIAGPSASVEEGNASETNSDPSAIAGDPASPSRANDSGDSLQTPNPAAPAISAPETLAAANAEPAQPRPKRSQIAPPPGPPPRQPSGHGLGWVRPVATLALLAGVAATGYGLWRHGLPSLSNRPAVPATTEAGKALPTSPGPRIPRDRLLLQTKEPSWLEVRTQGGAILHFGVLQGEKSFTNQAGLQVRAGRPDLIAVQMGDGAPRTLGTIDDLNWWTIHPDGRITPLATETAP